MDGAPPRRALLEVSLQSSLLCVVPVMDNVIGGHCFSSGTVHADARARFPGTQNVKTIWLFPQIGVKCSVTRASAGDWIFKRPGQF